MKIRAYAKINLSLDVLGRRPNGYHDVKMIMQSVGIYDELTINTNDTGYINLSCSDPRLTCDESNLIYKAAKSILSYSDSEAGVDIHLNKNIPMAAGMAGGSADAAATFVGINELLSLGLSNETLRELGVKLGADIPFCIEGGTYLSEGIGEVLTKLPDVPDCYLVISKPDIDVSTKYVYENLVLNDTTVHPDVDGMILGIRGNSLEAIIPKMSNLLETVTATKYPIIGKIESILLDNNALGSMMSGSGPTVFSIFDNEEAANKAFDAIRNKMPDCNSFVTTLSRCGTQII